MSEIQITETVRDALQGIETLIATDKKTEYAQALINVGFDCVDIGSFVSSKAVPQMADTEQVLHNLTFTNGKRSMVLVVNAKGAAKASRFPHLTEVSYPYSVSPTFLQRNLKISVDDAKETLRLIHETTLKSGLNFVVYLSMGLGNPYGDDWSIQLLTDTVNELYTIGIRNMPLSDILGEASPDRIFEVYNTLIPLFKDVDFGLHLHTKPGVSFAKLEAAFSAGVRSFESVTNGLGGCPFAASKMVGNLSTQQLIQFCDQKGIPLTLNREAYQEAIYLANNILQ